jgi:succinate dehydrogenase / fumarate reductase cytochrome b subunit
MSATAASAPLDRPAAKSRFWSARLASFLAVVPLSVWTFGHVWNNLAVWQGGDAWQKAVTEYPHPIAQLLTGVIVLVPLGLHTIWGIGRLYSSKPNNVRYGFFANFKYLLQRLSAIGVLLFLGAHLWLAMLAPRLGIGGVPSHAEQFADISHEMHFHGPTLAVYILGTLGVSYHLANGLQQFCMGWGVVSSRRALKQLEWVTILVFFVLLAMCWGAIYGLYSATSVAGA